MPFKFQKGTDYYSMFEACMSDEDWNAVADDPEDYEEFLLALEAGTFVPKD